MECKRVTSYDKSLVLFISTAPRSCIDELEAENGDGVKTWILDDCEQCYGAGHMPFKTYSSDFRRCGRGVIVVKRWGIVCCVGERSFLL
jgi:hypothetical protein